MPTPSPQGPSADSLFSDWLARHEAGEPADLEALCEQHPELAGELRELHAGWSRIESLRRRLDLALEPRPGAREDEDADAGADAAGGAGVATPESYSSEVLSRLAGRTPSSVRYRLQGEVARGGMGAVLRGWDEELRRHLAMKVMLTARPAGAAGTPPGESRHLARFLEEAQITGQLDHPGIVPVHELGLDAQGHVFFTMKLVQGRTLQDVFAELARGEGGWTQARVLGLLLKVCEAMSYAHAKGVIHRDLKPGNVMVGRFGEVYVMDWGLARVLGREDGKDLRIRDDERMPLTSEVTSERSEQAGGTPDSPLYTMDGDVVGTPAYMSPEQARGDLQAIGPASDVYAVGAMLYHLLSGHMPYVRPGERASNYAVWRWVREGPPPRLEAEARGVPVELAAICAKAMAREIGARYRDMRELADDLAAWVEGRVVRAHATGAVAEARKWIARNRALAGALAAAVVLLAAGLVASLVLRSEAVAQRKLAQHNATLAQASERRAREQTTQVLRLSDARVLETLESDADALWPPHPDRIDALQAWLERARALAAGLSEHRATLARMREAAHPYSDEERKRDRETHPGAALLAQDHAELDALVASLETGLDDKEGDRAEKRATQLEEQIRELEPQVDARRTWTFDTPQEQWQHDLLADLVAGLEKLEAGLLAEDAITPDHGWSVPRRLAFARELERRVAPGGDVAQAWEQALPAIRERYPGLDLAPQLGLVPIGPDPDSGLWEFAHLMSGAPPVRGADGRLELGEATGVVLALLPGGTFQMGAQRFDTTGSNYDPNALDDQSPVHPVELSPFFLSKYEITQGQWSRLTGRNPSYYSPEYYEGPPPPVTLLDPVEQVSWYDCRRELSRAGLALPSEAQWEYGARGGTHTVWWTGDERESLATAHAVNVADGSAVQAGLSWASVADWPQLDDGAVVHTAVGTYAANPFGLHEVVGNVWEWCQDAFDPEFYQHSPRRDPMAERIGAYGRVQRGGSYDSTASAGRSAVRDPVAPSTASPNVGARPARALDR